MSPQWTITKKLASQTQVAGERPVAKSQNRVNCQAFRLDTRWLVAKNAAILKVSAMPHLGHVATGLSEMMGRSIYECPRHRFQMKQNL